MNAYAGRLIVVTGATGRQGSAVTHALLQDGWHVRALTRSPNSPKARTLSTWGAEVMQGDMNDPNSLTPVFQGAYGVFSVQNPMISGIEGEIKQGKHVADAAQQAGVQHLVYGSAGVGKPSGVPSWDSKLQIEAYLKSLAVPLTILRPMAFMELMTDKGYYPQVSTWHLMPKLMGSMRPVVWLSTRDLGMIVAKAFAAPETFIGQDISLASDVKSIDECRAIYSKVLNKKTPRFPMPIWMFKKFVGDDLIIMWEWLRKNEVDLNTQPTSTIHPQALSVEEWLQKWERSELPSL